MDQQLQGEISSQDNFASETRGPDDEVNIFTLLLVLAKHARTILMVCLVVFVLSSGLVMLMPNIFSAASRLSVLVTTPDRSGDFYTGLTRGRTFQDAVIDRTGLLSNFSSREKCYQWLDKNVKAVTGKKDGIIVVSVEATDPLRAAELANAYASELILVNERLEFERIGVLRQMLGDRLQAVKTDLLAVKKSLAAAQVNNPTLKLDDQTSFFVESISRLKREDFLGKESMANEALKLQMAQAGTSVIDLDSLSKNSELSLATQYSRLLRELSVQEVTLATQYELAKIDEVRNKTKIQLLDKATPPDKKSKPKRGLIVLLATMAAGFLAILGAFVREYGSRMNDDDRQLWNEIKQSMARRTNRTER